MVSANLPWIESPFFEEILKTKNLTAEQSRLVREYNEQGYVVLKGLIPPALVERTLQDAEKKAFNPDFELKTQRDETRVQDFWKVSDAARELAIYQPIL